MAVRRIVNEVCERCGKIAAVLKPDGRVAPGSGAATLSP